MAKITRNSFVMFWGKTKDKKHPFQPRDFMEAILLAIIFKGVFCNYICSLNVHKCYYRFALYAMLFQ